MIDACLEESVAIFRIGKLLLVSGINRIDDLFDLVGCEFRVVSGKTPTYFAPYMTPTEVPEGRRFNYLHDVRS